MDEVNIKGPIEYIKEAWGIYSKKENFIFFARIMAVLVILSSVVSYAIGYFYPADFLENFDYSNVPGIVTFVILSLFSIVLGLWSQSTQYFAILNIGKTEKEVFALGFRKIGRYFLISLVVGLIIFLGLILLIIPAIIFGVWYSFTTWLVLDKGMGVKEALKTSKSMVSGKFWKVLGRSFVFSMFGFIVSIALSFAPYAGTLLISFLAPLFMLPFYLMYKDLTTVN